MCFAPQRRTLFRHPNLQQWREHVVFCTFWLGNVLSGHNGVHFFDIRTSKSGANMWCFVHFDFAMCFAPQRRALFQHPNLQEWREHVVFCTFWLGNVLRATTACTFSTSQLPKVVRSWCVLYILTSKCASRHNGVHFFDISTSKSRPTLGCFAHFDFEMCFAPQRRALFRHLSFQKWSEAGVFCTFWLRNVLRATTACTFSTSQLPKVVRHWGVLYILTSKCASRHNGVQIFISHLASWLRTRRFSEPTFRPSGATNHWKNTVFRDFPTFSRICIFFLLTLSLLIFSLLIFLFSLPLPCSAFHLSILSEVWLLNFLRPGLTTAQIPGQTLMPCCPVGYHVAIAQYGQVPALRFSYVVCGFPRSAPYHVENPHPIGGQWQAGLIKALRAGLATCFAEKKLWRPIHYCMGNSRVFRVYASNMWM